MPNHALGAMAGNAMHLGAVGAVLLWALGCTISEVGGRACGAQPAIEATISEAGGRACGAQPATPEQAAAGQPAEEPTLAQA